MRAGIAIIVFERNAAKASRTVIAENYCTFETEVCPLSVRRTFFMAKGGANHHFTVYLRSEKYVCQYKTKIY